MLLYVDYLGQQISGLPAEGETYPASLNGPEFQGTNAVGINVQSQVIFWNCVSSQNSQVFCLPNKREVQKLELDQELLSAFLLKLHFSRDERCFVMCSLSYSAATCLDRQVYATFRVLNGNSLIAILALTNSCLSML